jgi:hypothetical protein
MIKNRELALIPDSALRLLEPPPTAPRPRPATTGTPDATDATDATDAPRAARRCIRTTERRGR